MMDYLLLFQTPAHINGLPTPLLPPPPPEIIPYGKPSPRRNPMAELPQGGNTTCIYILYIIAHMLNCYIYCYFSCHYIDIGSHSIRQHIDVLSDPEITQSQTGNECAHDNIWQ